MAAAFTRNSSSPPLLTCARSAAHYAIRSLFDPYETDAHVYCYKVERQANLNLD